MKNMREFLKGLELESDTIDTIMAEFGKNTTKDKEKITELEKQIDDANKEIKSYKEMDIDGIKKSATDWETKYNELVKSQEEAKNEAVRSERVNELFKDIKFTSDSAKAGVISEFNKKEFKYDEESKKFIGASEWLEEIKEKDKGAFMSDVANPKFSTTPSAPTGDSSLDEIKEAMGISLETKNK